jgi:hypothetical protein
MTTPTVSVVMSVFNSERFLREAVESILEQSFRQFEFIIIDDGSTDRSPSILDRYRTQEPRVRVYRQDNKGLIESLNRGCELSRGKYIARMDADDISVRDRLALQVSFMESHPQFSVVGGAVEVINAAGDPLAIYHPPIRDQDIKAGLLRAACVLWHPAVLISRQDLVSMGGYRKIVAHAEDYDLWLRMAERFQFANVAEVVLRYRRHAGQVSIQKCRQQAISTIAATAAAFLRRSGRPDPLDAVTEITPNVLSDLGVSDAMQHTAFARRYVCCIRDMLDSKEYSQVLDVIDKLRCCELGQVSSAVMADFHLLEARLYWYQRKFAKTLVAVANALLTRPIILARPLKPLLRRCFSGARFHPYGAIPVFSSRRERRVVVTR